MRKPFEAGDEVTHKGHTWVVVYCDMGLVCIRSGDENKVVRQNQVRIKESKR